MKCGYCQNTNQNQLATCLECNSHFCNNQTTQKKLSHILKHVKEAKHIFFSFHNTGTLQCQKCSKNNMMGLYYDVDGRILCDIHRNESCIKIVQGSKVSLLEVISNKNIPEIAQFSGEQLSQNAKQTFVDNNKTDANNTQTTSSNRRIPKFITNSINTLTEYGLAFESTQNVQLALANKQLFDQLYEQVLRQYPNYRFEQKFKLFYEYVLPAELVEIVENCDESEDKELSVNKVEDVVEQPLNQFQGKYDDSVHSNCQKQEIDCCDVKNQIRSSKLNKKQPGNGYIKKQKSVQNPEFIVQRKPVGMYNSWQLTITEKDFITLQQLLDGVDDVNVFSHKVGISQDKLDQYQHLIKLTLTQRAEKYGFFNEMRM